MSRVALLVLFVSVGMVVAQEPSAISQHAKPGDALHYFVRFDGNPDLTGLAVAFGLQGQVKKDQSGLQVGFGLSEMKKVSPGLFEVNGTIPNNIATGTYQLIQVSAAHSPEVRNYNYPQDFKDKLTIEIVSDMGFQFPDIKSISSNPPK